MVSPGRNSGRGFSRLFLAIYLLNSAVCMTISVKLLVYNRLGQTWLDVETSAAHTETVSQASWPAFGSPPVPPPEVSTATLPTRGYVRPGYAFPCCTPGNNPRTRPWSRQ